MIYRIEIAPLAEQDLGHIYQWVSGEAGDGVALAYLARVQDRIAALRHFPKRGTPRPDIGRDVRSIPFERTLIIGYRVFQSHVRVERIVHGARPLEGLL